MSPIIDLCVGYLSMTLYFALAGRREEQGEYRFVLFALRVAMKALPESPLKFDVHVPLFKILARVRDQ